MPNELNVEDLWFFLDTCLVIVGVFALVILPLTGQMLSLMFWWVTVHFAIQENQRFLSHDMYKHKKGIGIDTPFADTFVCADMFQHLLESDDHSLFSVVEW